jgi:hypothetical protein
VCGVGWLAGPAADLLGEGRELGSVAGEADDDVVAGERQATRDVAADVAGADDADLHQRPTASMVDA